MLTSPKISCEQLQVGIFHGETVHGTIIPDGTCPGLNFLEAIVLVGNCLGCNCSGFNYLGSDCLESDFLAVQRNSEITEITEIQRFHSMVKCILKSGFSQVPDRSTILKNFTNFHDAILCFKSVQLLTLRFPFSFILGME